MRDGIVIPFEDQFLVITNDNSGGIGSKEQDVVQVPYDTVSYHAFRVAVMECLSLGATPISVIVNNFCGDEEWEELVHGVEKGMLELELDLTITGSSETNIPLVQSAVGIAVLGKKRVHTSPLIEPGLRFAVIGEPLVGEEVMHHKEKVAPLPLFQWICKQEKVVGVIPVGSKGILYELRQLLGYDIQEDKVRVGVDMQKSAGPSTCFIVAYEESLHEVIRLKAEEHFYTIDVK
ncbi:ATP-binding protein [Alkalihalobacillus sp. CinArs1]|uniref:ATP-binding protein n=1 Tax=Alkalihalobacillus sp. CinArs1 TaxID=2995314 RepID=UPI0022DE1C74|nr:ATP-binding protein [Alkalihalobacillus sp. CinArs1]